MDIEMFLAAVIFGLLSAYFGLFVAGVSTTKRRLGIASLNQAIGTALVWLGLVLLVVSLARGAS